jgi:predicted nucleic acid-binding protein
MLPHLYQRVLIPQAVLDELTHPKAPSQVNAWASTPPDWLEVVEGVALAPDLSSELDLGEREAISLAVELQPDAILMDEQFGRREAERLGLRVAGTLSILLDLARSSQLDFPDALQSLRLCGFYLSASLESSMLREYNRSQ